MLDKKTYTTTLLIISLTISVLTSFTSVTADFSKTNEDVEKWSQSTISVDYTNDEYLKLNLAFSDDTGNFTFISYLTFHSILNLPLDVISYLNHNKRDQTADYGLQVQTSRGNFSLGLNGTIIVDTPETGPIFIEMEEGDQETVADFSSFLGENVFIPLNFIPFVFPVEISSIQGLNGVRISFAPYAEMNVSSILEARVMDQSIIFENQQDVYVDTFSVEKDFSEFSTEMRDMYLDIINATLLMKTIDIVFTLETDLGDFSQTFNIDLSEVNTSIIMDPIGEILLFYVSSTFYLGDLYLSVALNSASFAFLSIFAAIFVLIGFMYWRKKKIR